MANIQLIPIIPVNKVISPVKVMAALGMAMRNVVSEGQRKIAEYPPKKGASTYRRTGTLKRSWSSQVKSGGGRIEGVVGSNSNVAPYNVIVQGVKGKQSWFFAKRGWMSASKLGKSMESDLVKECNEAIKEATQ